MFQINEKVLCTPRVPFRVEKFIFAIYVSYVTYSIYITHEKLQKTHFLKLFGLIVLDF
jgi:hypothetical protein